MERIDLLEKRVDKVEDNVMTILQEISAFKPILENINKSIIKLSEGAVDKERVVKLEEEVDELKKQVSEETVGKKAKLLEEIIKYIILAIVGVAIGYFIK